MVTRAHTQVLVHNRLIAIVPFLRKKCHKVAICDGVEYMRYALGDKKTITFPDIQELLLTIRLCHHDTITLRDKVVFVVLRVIVIAAYLASINELEIEFNDRFVWVEGKDTAAPVADST